ncbi:MAG: hypothetical protein QFX40_08275 [Archaeoglobales archaeon]|nr:hypothetical protein [Archaeoglobales archaeon]
MIVRLALSGLSCKACLKAVRVALEEVGAVVKEISLKEVVIEVMDNDLDKYINAIRNAGYDAKPLTTSNQNS